MAQPGVVRRRRKDFRPGRLLRILPQGSGDEDRRKNTITASVRILEAMDLFLERVPASPCTAVRIASTWVVAPLSFLWQPIEAQLCSRNVERRKESLVVHLHVLHSLSSQTRCPPCALPVLRGLPTCCVIRSGLWQLASHQIGLAALLVRHDKPGRTARVGDRKR